MKRREPPAGRLVHLFVLALCFLVSGTSSSRGDIWEKEWDKIWGGSHNDVAAGIVLDSYGNIVVAGNKVVFGRTNTLVKLRSSDRSILWERTWGRSGDEMQALAIDGNNNTYAASVTPGASFPDQRLAVYGSTGSLIANQAWSKDYYDFPAGVAYDNGRNALYLLATAAGEKSHQIYLSRIEKSGSTYVETWCRTLGGIGADYGRDVAVDADGNVYVVGFSNDGFGGATIDDWEYPEVGGVHVSGLFKYSSAGELIWARLWGNATGWAEAEAITIDGEDIIVVGTIGKDAPGDAIPKYTDMFMRKYDADGNFQWEKTRGSGTSSEFAKDVVATGSGKICVVGYAYGPFDGELHRGGADCFAAIFNYTGTWESMRMWGSAGDDFALDATVAGSDVYVCGSAMGPFDGDEVFDYSDYFVSKLVHTLQADPSISASPWSLMASCPQGGNAANQAFEVWNSGGGTLAYSLSTEAAWFSISPASGSSTGGHNTHQVIFDASGLEAGIYSDYIEVTAPGANNMMTVEVILSVTDTASDFSYTINGSGVTITGYDGPGGEVVIPSLIQGLSVTEIGDSAFERNTNLTSVAIPADVTNIGNGAFEGCYNLVSVNIPASVTNIGDEAFLGCYDLASVAIPNGVIRIGDWALASCGSLTSVTIPASVVDIGERGLNSWNLLSVNVDPANPAYSSVGGVLFNKDKTLLVYFPGGLTGDYTVPNGVIEIGEFAFEETALTSVTLPPGVTTLRRGAFADTRISSFTLPGTLVNIGEDAFYWSFSLTSITIPAGVTNIGPYAFSECPMLAAINVNAANQFYSSLSGVLFNKSQTEIIQYPEGKAGAYTIPSSVTSIGVGAFVGYRQTSITIPASVTSIGDNAFTYSYLTSVTIPASVAQIGVSPFSCEDLTAINVNAANPYFSSVSGVLFDKGQTKLIQYPQAKAGSTYAIPASVNVIGEGAFQYCYQLTGVTIPEGVGTIEEDAFFSCENLGNVVIPDSVTHIGWGAFLQCHKMGSVTIGRGVAYLGDRAFWHCSSMTSAYFRGDAPDVGGRLVFEGTNVMTVFYLPLSAGWEATYCGRPTAPYYPTCSITLGSSPSAGGTVSGGGAKAYGSTVTVVATPQAGYVFESWRENGVVLSTDSSYAFTATRSCALVAHFVTHSGVIALSASPPEAGEVIGAGTYVNGSLVTVMAPANTGYTFANWTENGAIVNSSASYSFTAAGNRTLVANFTLNNYGITLGSNPTGGGTTSGGGTKAHGSSVSVLAAANSGFAFANWTENGTVQSTDNPYDFTATRDRTLMANYAVLPWPVPGAVEFENYNNGGPGVAFSDTTVANEGGQYRLGEGVDIAGDVAAGNGHVVGWTKAGEWLEYSINVASPGTYLMETHVAAVGAGGQFRILVNGEDKTGLLAVPNTGAWSTYQPVSKPGITLSAGIQTVRVAMVAAGTSGNVGAFDWFRVVLPSLVISPVSTAVVAEASSGRQIEVAANVSWVASTNVPWLRITSEASGTTNGVLTYSVTNNAATTARTGSIIVAGGGIIRTCTVVQAGAVPPPRMPYPSGTPWPMPGTVEAENFDQGGAGAAYGDATPANEGGQYRTGEGVDIANDAGAGNGRVVGWTAAGEWLEYTVSLSAPGTYALETRVAAVGAGGQFRIWVNGVDKTGLLAVPNTGAWNAYQTVSKGAVSLSSGIQTVRVEMVTAGPSGNVGAFDWFRVAAETPVVQTAYPSGTPWPLPGTMEAENFDQGGSGVAYGDATPANEGGQYRTGEGVDIANDTGAGNGRVVGWTAAGEWLEYTVSLSAPGTYALETRVAAVGAGGQFRIVVNGVDKTGLLAVPNTGAWNAYQTVSKSGVALSSGIQTVRVEMVTAGPSGNVGAFDWFRVAAETPVVQTAYPSGTPWPMPGTVEAENFDNGGAGVAYGDATPANEGGQYRTGEGVDIANDAGAGNGRVVGWTAAGEWLEYTVSLSAPGTYALETRVAAVGAGGQFRIVVNGVDKTGLLAVPNTGAWNAYQVVSKGGVALSSGIQTVRVEMVTAGSSGNVGAFDWFRVSAETPVMQSAYPSGTPWPLPGTVEIENFDNGGSGVAYGDATAANEGGQYRLTEGVDIARDTGAGNSYVVGWTPAGEWLEYTVSLSAPGTYALETRVAAVGAGGQFRILVNGVDKTGLLAVPNTGAWNAYQTVSKSGVALSSGIQTVRVEMVTAGPSGNVGAFDWFRLVPVSMPVQTAYPNGTPWPLPGTVETENFDNGGQGLAYGDTTSGNAGGAYRVGEGVDIARDTGAGGGHVVGWTAAGEWLEYTVSLSAPGTYALETRVAAVGAGGQFRIWVNGVDKTGLLAVPNTGAWNAYQTVSKGGVALSSGIQTVRVEMVTAGPSGHVGAFDWFRVASAARRAPSTSDAVTAMEELPLPVEVRSSQEDLQPGEGWLAVDGDVKTTWPVVPSAGGGWLVLTYDPQIALNGLAIDWASDSPTNSQFLYSLDADTWIELVLPLTNGPVNLNHLWLLFPGDDLGKAPAIREIHVE